MRGLNAAAQSRRFGENEFPCGRFVFLSANRGDGRDGNRRKSFALSAGRFPPLSMAAKPPRGLLNCLDKKAGFSLADVFLAK